MGIEVVVDLGMVNNVVEKCLVKFMIRFKFSFLKIIKIVLLC